MDKNGSGCLRSYINQYHSVDPSRKDLFSIEFLPYKYMLNKSTLDLINSRITTCDFSIIYTPLPGFNVQVPDENFIKMHFIEGEDMKIFNYFEKIASKRVFDFRYIFYNSCLSPIKKFLFKRCIVKGIEVTGEELTELIIKVVFDDYEREFCCL